MFDHMAQTTIEPLQARIATLEHQVVFLNNCIKNPQPHQTTSVLNRDRQTNRVTQVTSGTLTPEAEDTNDDITDNHNPTPDEPTWATVLIRNNKKKHIAKLPEAITALLQPESNPDLYQKT
jgi:hypothetical protein